MTMKKLLCGALALILTLTCACAFAEGDLQAQLDAANARIAELETLIELYKPYYQSQVVATYGDDGVIWLDDVQAEYDSQAAYYKQYGIDLEQYGLANDIKTNIIKDAVTSAILDQKAQEMELQLSNETLAELEETTQETIDYYLKSYYDYFYPDAEDVTDEMKTEAETYWAQNGLDHDTYLESAKKDALQEELYDVITKDVAINEDDVKAAYDALVEANKVAYANDSTYNSDRNSGVAIAWNPEGYRAVKHVLVKFDDDQNARYTELQSTLASLNAEKEAIENPAEPTEEAAEAETEPTPEPRSLEEINADIAACATEIEALYAQLEPKANEVVEKFNAGTSFEDLIAEYNQDPGMTREPIATIGYAVKADSTTWDPAFTEGAMSIPEIGQISAPVRGSYGFYVIYYLGDVTPGEVDMETIRASLEEDALEKKIAATYEEQVEAWLNELGVTYYLENFGVTEG